MRRKFSAVIVCIILLAIIFQPADARPTEKRLFQIFARAAGLEVQVVVATDGLHIGIPVDGGPLVVFVFERRTGQLDRIYLGELPIYEFPERPPVPRWP